MDILKGIQKWPLRTRKIILWVTVIVFGIILMGCLFKRFEQRLRGSSQKELTEQLQQVFLKEGLSTSQEEVYQEFKKILKEITEKE